MQYVAGKQGIAHLHICRYTKFSHVILEAFAGTQYSRGQIRKNFGIGQGQKGWKEKAERPDPAWVPRRPRLLG